ncbi:MAG: glycosyltransferase [Halosimplex sp.]
MTDEPTIAVAHYPEGAGHATRMLAVAEALECAGASVRVAGGGAGTQFVALNGYDEFEPAVVDYIDTYQDGSMRRVLAESVPATADRVTDYVEWLREGDFDALVTDDMFAAIAATRTDVPLYALKHDLPALYHDRVERAGARFHTEFQIEAAREFFYPAVWPPDGTGSAGTTRVPPIALDGDGRDRPAADVVVVPSHYSELGRIADNLDRQGYDVIDVGSDEWDPVPSLLPYIRDADVVVCSGYSTVMDAAVAGTPCVVHPATDEQDAVAERVRAADVPGFAVAEDPLDVFDAVSSPPDAPSFDNGAAVVAERVLDDLDSDAASSDAGPSRARGSPRQVRRAGDRAVAGAAALGTAVRVTAARGRDVTAAATAHARRTAVEARRRVDRLRRRVLAAVASFAARARRATETARRHATATVAMLVALAVVARSGASGVRSRTDRAVVGARSATTRTANATKSALRSAADGAATALDRIASVGRRLKRVRRSPE